LLAADERFGTRLRAARDRTGLTQAELATRAGMSRSAVAEAEGGREPLLGTALRLARVVASLDAESTVAGLLLGADAPRARSTKVWPVPVNVTLDLGGKSANRRDALKLAGVLMLSGLTDNIDLEKVGWVTLHPDHVDSRMVKVLRSWGLTIIEGRWELPTGALYSLMRGHLTYLSALLAASHGAPARVELAHVVGEAHAFAGRLADYLAQDEARRHFAAAAEIGRTYDLVDVQALAVLGLANEQLVWVPADVKLKAVQPVLDQYDRLPLPLQAWTDIELGDVYARQGREDDFNTVMDRAQDAVIRFTDEDRVGNFREWDTTKIAALRAALLMEFGREQLAIDAMNAVLPALEQRTPARALTTRTDIAECLRRLGERSAALDLANDVYQDAQRDGYASPMHWASRVFVRAGERPN
jgi:DNA-binding XRE family transcriptional regulator